MSLSPWVIEPVPNQTVLIVRAAFPKGNLYLSMRNELGLYSINIVRAVNFLNGKCQQKQGFPGFRD
jgi:transposase